MTRSDVGGTETKGIIGPMMMVEMEVLEEMMTRMSHQLEEDRGEMRVRSHHYQEEKLVTMIVVERQISLIMMRPVMRLLRF